MKIVVLTSSKEGKVGSIPVISISASVVSFLDKQKHESTRTCNRNEQHGQI